MKEVKGEEIIHHEAASLFDVPQVATSATLASVYGTQSGGTFNGYAYLILGAPSHSPSTGPNAGKLSYPRQGQHILFKNNSEWRIAGVDKTVAFAHKLFLQKVNANMPTLAQSITQVGATYGGDTFIVHTNSWEEATLGQREGLIPVSRNYTSWLQTFTDKYEVTDLMEMNETYPFKWHDKTINFTYVKGIADTEIRFAAAIDNGLFLQNKDDGQLTNIDPITGEVKYVYTTWGYIQQLEASAQKMYYDSFPTVSLFRTIARYRRAQQQSGNVIMHVGAEFMFKAEDIITQIGASGSLVYDRKAVDLDIRQVRTGGVTFNVKLLKILNHAKFGGAPGFPYPYYFVVAPMDKIQDPKTNVPRDAFTILYKKAVGEGARGHYKIWETGANARNGATNERMNREIHMYTHMGMQVVGASKFILGKPLP
jgi:hypothetical protein